jgi:tripartite-type tricarboxylate transporter receptor subunit TctC
VAEAGLSGYDSTGWFGVVAPAGTAPSQIAKLSTALNTALRDPQIQTSMRNLGVEPAPGTPDAFASYIASETTKWTKVIRQANIRLE